VTTESTTTLCGDWPQRIASRFENLIFAVAPRDRASVAISRNDIELLLKAEVQENRENARRVLDAFEKGE